MRTNMAAHDVDGLVGLVHLVVQHLDDVRVAIEPAGRCLSLVVCLQSCMVLYPHLPFGNLIKIYIEFKRCTQMTR